MADSQRTVANQRFRHEKETKNTHRFDAVNGDGPPAVENLYIQKWALGEEAPGEIEVEVTVADE